MIGHEDAEKAFLEAWQAGRAAGAAMVALPEMFLTGYQTQDLVLKPAFVADAMAAMEALAFTLAKEEMRHGVRVNVVKPSLTVTDMGARLAKAVTGVGDIHDLDARFPFGRVSVPEDVAAAVVWLVSSANPYVSGQAIAIDGSGGSLRG